MRYDIFVPQNFKRSLVRGLIIGAWRICSSDEPFQKEVGFIKDLLQCSGYPHNFIRKQDFYLINKVNQRLNQTYKINPNLDLIRKIYLLYCLSTVTRV